MPGPLLCQTNPPPNPVCTRKPCLAEPKSFTNPVLYGRPRPCRTKSESPASTPQLRQQTGTKASARRSLGQTAPRQSQDTLQTKRRQGKRKALTRPSSAKARARRSLDQAVPRQSQDTHQDKQRRGKLPPQLRQQTGAKANARRSLDQAAPGQAQDTHRDKQRRGKLPPSKPIRTSNARPSGARYTNRNRQSQGRPAISVAEIRNY